MNIRTLLTVAALTLTSLVSQAQSTFTTTGVISSSSSVFASPYLSRDAYYSTLVFNSSVAGTVSISLSGIDNTGGDFDTLLYLYSSFSTSSTSAGLLSVDDDSGPGLASYLSYNILANTNYTLVISEYLPTSYTAATGTYSLSIVGPEGSTISTNSVSAVPEPSTYGLMGAAALGGLSLLRRRKAKNA